MTIDEIDRLTPIATIPIALGVLGEETKAALADACRVHLDDVDDETGKATYEAAIAKLEDPDAGDRDQVILPMDVVSEVEPMISVDIMEALDVDPENYDAQQARMRLPAVGA